MSDGVYQYLEQTFEWDDEKARKNWAYHRVLFTEAATAFFDPNVVFFEDLDHSLDEQRVILMGHSRRDRRLFVVHVYRGVRIRIISAREVTPQERSAYEAELGRRL